MLNHPRAVQHGPNLLGPLLQPAKGLLHMLRLNGRLALAGRVKQRVRVLALLDTRVIGAVERARQVLLLLDLEGHLGERLDHLERQEAKDVDDIVRGLAVRHDAEARPLAEALALAVREGGLAVLGPGDVLLARHGLCALVGLAQALQRDVVHLLLLLVLLVLALGHLDRVEGRGLPGEADLGLFVLLGRVVDGTARHDAAADGVIARREIRVGALVIRVLDILSHVFP